MKKDIIIEDVLLKKTVKIGNSCHVLLPKRLEGRSIYILVIAENVTKPKIDYKKKKVHFGKTYHQAEITNNAGTHKIWIEKDKIKEIFKR